MQWRKRVIRFAFLFLAVLVLVVGWLYRHWTDPGVVRDLVLAELREQLLGVDVQLGSVQVRVLGGVHLEDLRLTRAGFAEPFASFPSLVLYPDKGDLLEGKLTIQKVVLESPHFTLVRRADGTLNWCQLRGRSTGRPTAIPLVELHQGLITLLDHQVGPEPLTLSQLHATLVPTSSEDIQLELQGQADALGPFSCRAAANLVREEALVQGSLPEVPIQRKLLERMARYFPALRPHLVPCVGLAELKGDLAWHPKAAQPLSYTLQVRVKDLKLDHPQLPMPIEHGDLSARLEAGRVHLEKLDFSLGKGQIQATGDWQALSEDADFTLKVKTRDIAIHPDLYDRLPTPLQRICREFHPRGRVAVAGEIRRVAGKLHVQKTIQFEDMQLQYEDFPYPLGQVHGTMDYIEHPERTPVLRLDLRGQASRQPIAITGEVFGEGLRPTNDWKCGLRIDIRGESIPVDEVLFKAIKPQTRATLRRFEPTGKVNLLVQARREAGVAECPYPEASTTIRTHFHHGTLKFDRFPYPLEDVEAEFEIKLPGEDWKLLALRGSHKSGQITATAFGSPSDKGAPSPSAPLPEREGSQSDRYELRIQGTNILMDDELLEVIPAKPRKVCQYFRPQGRFVFSSHLQGLSQDEPSVDLTVNLRQSRIRPTFFPYEIGEMTGSFRYAGDTVTLGEMAGTHGTSKIQLGKEGRGGKVSIRKGGGFLCELHLLRGDPLTLDDELLKALPTRVSAVAASVKPDKPFKLALNLIVDSTPDDRPDFYGWSAEATFEKCKLMLGIEASNCTGRVTSRGTFDGEKVAADGNLRLDTATFLKLPFRNIRSSVKTTEQVTIFSGVEAAVYGGNLYGSIRLDHLRGFQYRLDLTASQIDLEQFARNTLDRSGQVRGQLYGRVQLSGKEEGIDSIRGSGSLNVARGHIYDLPLIVNLLNVLVGNQPRGAAFQEVVANFTVEGKQLHVNQFDLLGEAMTLRGQGDMKYDGTEMNLEMYGLLWGRGLPLLPPLIDRIPPAISKHMMRIRIQGSIDNLDIHRDPVPVLTEPLRRLWRLGPRQLLGQSTQGEP